MVVRVEHAIRVLVAACAMELSAIAAHVADQQRFAHRSTGETLSRMPPSLSVSLCVLPILAAMAVAWSNPADHLPEKSKNTACSDFGNDLRRCIGLSFLLAFMTVGDVRLSEFLARGIEMIPWLMGGMAISWVALFRWRRNRRLAYRLVEELELGR